MADQARKHLRRKSRYDKGRDLFDVHSCQIMDINVHERITRIVLNKTPARLRGPLDWLRQVHERSLRRTFVPGALL